jgi:hypothetical protein
MRTRIRLLASTLTLAAGSALVSRNSRPPKPRLRTGRFYTRPAVARSGLVTTGNLILSSSAPDTRTACHLRKRP